ncbi:MAG TPA: hypothetical protein VGC28_10165 [Sphingomonas sp.]
MNFTTSIFHLVSRCTQAWLNCPLFMRSESLITRGRFAPESAFRLPLADRGIAAGIYPMKKVRWPEDGLPARMTRQEHETGFTEYPFNPIGHGKQTVGQYADADGFIEVAEAPTGFMCIKRGGFLRMTETPTRTCNIRPMSRRAIRSPNCTGASSIASSTLKAISATSANIC